MELKIGDAIGAVIPDDIGSALVKMAEQQPGEVQAILAVPLTQPEMHYGSRNGRDLHTLTEIRRDGVTIELRFYRSDTRDLQRIIAF